MENSLKDYQEGGKFNSTPSPPNSDNSTGMWLLALIVIIILSIAY